MAPYAGTAARWAFQDVLARELVSRALLIETTAPQIVRPIGEDEESRGTVEEVELGMGQ